MFTPRIHPNIFFNLDNRDRPSETFAEDMKKRLETINVAEQQRMIEEMMRRSQEARGQWGKLQVSDQIFALDDLDRQLSILFTGSPPKDTPKIAWWDRGELRSTGAWATLKDIRLDTPSKTLSGKFAEAKFTNTENGVDIFTLGDRTILSIPGKDTVDFSTEIFKSRRDIMLSQFAQNNGVASPTVAQAPSTTLRSSTLPTGSKSEPRIVGDRLKRWPKETPADSFVSIDSLKQQITTIDTTLADFKIRLQKEAPLATTPEKQQELANLWRTIAQLSERKDALTAQLNPLLQKEATRVAQEDADRARALTQAEAQKKAEAAREAYAWLSPDQREIADMRTALSSMGQNFRSLLARDARWDKSVRPEMRSLFTDIKVLEGNLASLERWQSEVTRLQGEIKIAQAQIDVRRGNDTYGTLTKQIESAKAGIARIEGMMVVARASNIPILAQYKTWVSNIA